MTRARPVGLLGVPTSAGSHHAGQDRAPAALRAAGLPDALRARGVDVHDRGDLPATPHRVAPRVDGVRDAARVAAVAGGAADAVAAIVADGEWPLVLGGDCTITLGVLDGLARSGDVGLVYVDGDADLNLPGTSGSGVLDTMGVSHLLGAGAPELLAVGSRVPALTADRLALLGFDPGELDTGQWNRLYAAGLAAWPAPAVRADPDGSARAAVEHVTRGCSRFLAHLDVDVIDSGVLPLANFPHFAGLTLDEIATVLPVVAGDERAAGMVVTEVNPDHDPGGDHVRTLVGLVASAVG